MKCEFFLSVHILRSDLGAYLKMTTGTGTYMFNCLIVFATSVDLVNLN